MFLLLDEQTTNTTGVEDTVEWNISSEFNNGAVQAFGTFDGATVALQYSPDAGTTWFEVGDFTTFTYEGNGLFYLPGKYLLRGTVTGAGASTSVSLGVL